MTNDVPPEAVFEHRALLVNIGQSAHRDANYYEAARYAWVVDPERARLAEVVLAHIDGLIVAAFTPEQWHPATLVNFPGKAEDLPDRWGFVGSMASHAVWQLYVGRQMPDDMRRRGAANPVRYTYSADA